MLSALVDVHFLEQILKVSTHVNSVCEELALVVSLIPPGRARVNALPAHNL